jgi:hypothetical protein
MLFFILTKFLNVDYRLCIIDANALQNAAWVFYFSTFSANLEMLHVLIYLFFCACRSLAYNGQGLCGRRGADVFDSKVHFLFLSTTLF